MSDYTVMNYSICDGVATIAFNSPSTMNALSQKMRNEIMMIVDEVESDSTVRVAIVTGEGNSFCAGADLSEGLLGYPSFVEQCEAEYSPWLMGMHNSAKLYIAAVNGAAAGIGSAVMMNCDLVMMASNAYMYQAFSALGLMPDGGVTWQLLQRLGYHKAMEMAVDAGRLTAQECLELGLANKVVAPNQLLSEAQAWARKIAEGAPLAQKAVKGLMRNAYGMSYKDVMDQEAKLQSHLITTKDVAAGIDAFFAKKKPVFRGE